MTKVIRFPTRRASAPARNVYMSSNVMLCSMFDDETPIMDFILDVYRHHHILSVGDWDDRGGEYLFEKYKLDDASRVAFKARVGSPYRPATIPGAELVSLVPSA